VANVRRRRNTIILLENGDNIIEGDDNLLSYATEYYKNLFGPAPVNSFPADHDLWHSWEKVNEADNSLLTHPFSEDEIKHALFQMEKK